MSSAFLPLDSWDTHIHVFEPERFPYGIPRSYTPKAASLKEYPTTETNCTNILIVQATVQGRDAKPLLGALSEDGKPSKCNLLRGLTTVDPSKTSESELQALHEAGVRGIRMHEMSWGHGAQSSANNIAEKIRAATPKISKLEWVVDVFTDIRTWAALDGFIRHELDSRIKIVADHCGGAFPGDEQLEEFQTFLGLIADGYLNVKLSGFERLYDGHGSKMESLKSIVQPIIQAGQERIVYGSDWPHTQLGLSRKGKTDEQRLSDIEDFRVVDDELHIRKLRQWITDDTTWHNLWVNNPKRLFG